MNTAICLAAQNDTNGNPRRVWVEILPDGEVGRIADEGYRGFPFRGECAQGPRFATTPSEYRYLIKAKGEA